MVGVFTCIQCACWPQRGATCQAIIGQTHTGVALGLWRSAGVMRRGRGRMFAQAARRSLPPYTCGVQPRTCVSSRSLRVSVRAAIPRSQMSHKRPNLKFVSAVDQDPDWLLSLCCVGSAGTGEITIARRPAATGVIGVDSARSIARSTRSGATIRNIASCPIFPRFSENCHFLLCYDFLDFHVGPIHGIFTAYSVVFVFAFFLVKNGVLWLTRKTRGIITAYSALAQENQETPNHK